MISSVLLAVASISVQPSLEIVQLPVARANRVRVEVAIPGTIFEYGYELVVSEAPGEDGFLLRRDNVRPLSLPGLRAAVGEGEQEEGGPEVAKTPRIQARDRHVPPMHVDEHGAFTAFRQTGEHVERLARALHPALPDEMRETLLSQLGSSDALGAWLAVPRHEWSLLAAWEGVSLEPGKRTVEGELHLPVATLPSLPRTFEVEVGEPTESDGRIVVRLRRKTQVTWADMGDHVLAYLTVHGSTMPRMKVLDVVGTHVEELFLDVETGLPVRLTNEVRIALAVKTNRGKKRHNDRYRKSLRFDWTLRGE